MMQATYMKLRNGFWGLRVQGTPQPGEQVAVTRRDGGQRLETVGRVLWSGDGLAICSKSAGTAAGDGARNVRGRDDTSHRADVAYQDAHRDPGEDAADRWNETHGDKPDLMALAERFS